MHFFVHSPLPGLSSKRSRLKERKHLLSQESKFDLEFTFKIVAHIKADYIKTKYANFQFEKKNNKTPYGLANL